MGRRSVPGMPGRRSEREKRMTDPAEMSNAELADWLAEYSVSDEMAEAASRLRALSWNTDMEAAPKDGSRFLAYEPSTDGSFYECWWQTDFSNWEGWQNDWDSEPSPTHWMPLPAPLGGSDAT